MLQDDVSEPMCPVLTGVPLDHMTRSVRSGEVIGRNRGARTNGPRCFDSATVFLEPRDASRTAQPHSAPLVVATFECLVLVGISFPHSYDRRTLRRRRLFVTTLTELSAIAALAMIGLSVKPVTG